ncbi:hypothetical protein Hanom_Chr13g01230731 [Helianthus anomalus]
MNQTSSVPTKRQRSARIRLLKIRLPRRRKNRRIHFLIRIRRCQIGSLKPLRLIFTIHNFPIRLNLPRHLRSLHVNLTLRPDNPNHILTNTRITIATYILIPIFNFLHFRLLLSHLQLFNLHPLPQRDHLFLIPIDRNLIRFRKLLTTHMTTRRLNLLQRFRTQHVPAALQRVKLILPIKLQPGNRTLKLHIRIHSFSSRYRFKLNRYHILQPLNIPKRFRHILL